jgi:hypothetical protein
MAYFGYPKHKLKSLKLTQQHFLIQSAPLEALEWNGVQKMLMSIFRHDTKGI